MGATSAANAHGDRLADFTRDIRILILTLMALVIGGASSLYLKGIGATQPPR